MEIDGEVKQTQHFYHHGDTICHSKSGYVTTKLHGKSTCRCHNNAILSDRAIFKFPAVFACRPRILAAGKHWQFMPNWKNGSTLELIFVVFKMSFLPKYRVIYYDYTCIVK